MVALTHPILSAAEFAAAMERSGWRAPMELIEGEVVVIPPSGGEAAAVQTEIVHRVRAWQIEHGERGRVLTDVFVRVGDGYLAPDVAWWGAGREPEIGPGAVEAVPDLVIEVQSPATRGNDLGAKRQQYLRAGVRELWLADPGDRSVLCVDAAGERRLARTDMLESPDLLPGFGVAVADLFT
jgi:Uma2 family endonuclease